MADLTLKTETIKDIKHAVKVHLAGAIDASTVITFQQNLEKLKNDQGVRTFLLDMEGIRYVNSTGLGSLVKLADGLEKEGGVITLMRIHPKVKVVFDMLGLNAFFKIFEKEPDAIAFLKSGGKPDEIPEAEPIEEPPPVREPPKPAPEPRPARPKTAPSLKPISSPSVPAAAPAPSAPAQTAAGFPCSMCGLPLLASSPGDYRCPRCFHVFRRTPAGAIENTGRRKSIPVQLVLTGQDFCIEGFKRFVEVMAEEKGFADADVASLREAITETCRNIVDLAYDKNPNLSFQVLLTGEKGEITIRVADHGRKFDPDGDRFAVTRRSVTEFVHEPHPSGGNILRLCKRV